MSRVDGRVAHHQRAPITDHAEARRGPRILERSRAVLGVRAAREGGCARRAGQVIDCFVGFTVHGAVPVGEEAAWHHLVPCVTSSPPRSARSSIAFGVRR